MVEPLQELSAFSGSLDESAENFIGVLEKQARLAGLSESVLLRCFVPGKLHGDACKWFQNRMELNPFRDWIDFRTSLIKHFAPTRGVNPTAENTSSPPVALVFSLETNAFQGGSTPAAVAEEGQGEQSLVEHAGFNGPGDKLPDANNKELVDSVGDPSNAINIANLLTDAIESNLRNEEDFRPGNLNTSSPRS